jgi:hypothetical protein
MKQVAEIDSMSAFAHWVSSSYFAEARLSIATLKMRLMRV